MRTRPLSTPIWAVGPVLACRKDTSVVHALLNARYYNGNQGQFISQDPVFLSNPTNQHLDNPQSLNAYSYAEDNPIVNEDTNGQQAATSLAGQLQQLYSALEQLSVTLAAGGSAAATIAASPGIAITLGAIGVTIGAIALANRTTISTVSTASNVQSTSAFGPGIVSTPSVGPARGGALAFPIENPSSFNQPYTFSSSGAAGGLSGQAAADAARELGYTQKVNPGSVGIDTHGKPLYKNPDTGEYISPDRDSHSGGTWKGFDSNGERIGTFDDNLKRIGD